jgi:hypothetical protein
MKTLIILAASAALTVSAVAQGDDLSAPAISRSTIQPQPAPASEGAVQHAARVGNPLQLVNPFAPAAYGSGRDFVANTDATEVSHPHIHARPIGLRLFSITF